jgi:hypothetical protein
MQPDAWNASLLPSRMLTLSTPPALAGIADNIQSFLANTGMPLENVVRYE